MSRRDDVGALRRWCLGLDVDAFSKSALHVLIQYIDDDRETFVSVGRIAREGGMSERKARTVIASLEALGHIEVERSSGRLSNRYRLSQNPAQRAVLPPLQPGIQGRVDPAQRAVLKIANPAPQVHQPGTTGISTRHSVPPIGINGIEWGEQEASQGGDELTLDARSGKVAR
jgi:DNA-binding MarR family transcriptional regulator